jgi:hypothetical protein
MRHCDASFHESKINSEFAAILLSEGAAGGPNPGGKTIEILYWFR